MAEDIYDSEFEQLVKEKRHKEIISILKQILEDISDHPEEINLDKIIPILEKSSAISAAIGAITKAIVTGKQIGRAHV